MTLRLNVRDVEASAAALEARGVRVVIRREFWGTVGDFVDPDGNRCALRDEDSFPPPCAERRGRARSCRADFSPNPQGDTA